MEATIRFSLNEDRRSELRRKIVSVLSAQGFERANGRTATYVNSNATPAQMENAMSGFWDRVRTHDGPGTIDHFWTHVDTPAPDEPEA